MTAAQNPSVLALARLELRHQDHLSAWRAAGSPRPIPEELQRIRQDLNTHRKLRHEEFEAEQQR